MSYIVPKEIPMCCGICPCFHAEHPMHRQAVKADKNKMVYAPYEGGRPDWCPLIEVPTPHGRLIDADEFKNYIRSGYEEMKHLFNENLKAATFVTEGFCKDIDEAPTVIEAEDT